MFTKVSISSLPVGSKVGAAIFDERRNKLIAEGMEITTQLLEGLRKRSIDNVVVSLSDMGRFSAFRPQGKAKTTLPDREGTRVALESDHSRAFDHVAEHLTAGNLQASDNPFADRIRRPGAVAVSADLSRALAEGNEQNIASFGSMIESCAKNNEDVNLELIAQLTSTTVSHLEEDIDAVAGLAANPYTMSYPSRHSQHVAMLAQAIGATLGLDEKSLLELGIGCLIHDIGMLAIDQRIYLSQQHLPPSEFVEITKHPLKTFDIIEENLDIIPPVSRMVAYQIHERCNGMGYPRKRNASQTHPLARLASVADAYAALVAPRPHRPGMLPYVAMEKMLRDVGQGRFDAKAVRALLETLSLFPIGSYVALNDDYVGRVIRANGAHYDKPIIEVWKKDRLAATPAVVDLTNDSQLKIQRPLATLES